MVTRGPFWGGLVTHISVRDLARDGYDLLVNPKLVRRMALRAQFGSELVPSALAKLNMVLH